MGGIFISYRRSEASDVTGRIFDHLKDRFGAQNLFKDVDNVPLGTDFRDVIAHAVGRCDVLLAVIGPQWMQEKNDNGRLRLEDPEDWVHLEIVTALQRKIPVIPLLVRKADLPTEADLPEPLKPLAYRSATPIRSDPEFHFDIERLCDGLEPFLRSRPATELPEPSQRDAEPRPTKRPWALRELLTRRNAIITGTAVALVVIVIMWLQQSTPLVELQKPHVSVPGLAESEAEGLVESGAVIFIDDLDDPLFFALAVIVNSGKEPRIERVGIEIESYTPSLQAKIKETGGAPNRSVTTPSKRVSIAFDSGLGDYATDGHGVPIPKEGIVLEIELHATEPGLYHGSVYIVVTDGWRTQKEYVLKSHGFVSLPREGARVPPVTEDDDVGGIMSDPPVGDP